MDDVKKAALEYADELWNISNYPKDWAWEDSVRDFLAGAAWAIENDETLRSAKRVMGRTEFEIKRAYEQGAAHQRERDVAFLESLGAGTQLAVAIRELQSCADSDGEVK